MASSRKGWSQVSHRLVDSYCETFFVRREFSRLPAGQEMPAWEEISHEASVYIDVQDVRLWLDSALASLDSR